MGKRYKHPEFGNFQILGRLENFKKDSSNSHEYNSPYNHNLLPVYQQHYKFIKGVMPRAITHSYYVCLDCGCFYLINSSLVMWIKDTSVLDYWVRYYSQTSFTNHSSQKISVNEIQIPDTIP